MQLNRNSPLNQLEASGAVQPKMEQKEAGALKSGSKMVSEADSFHKK